MTQTDGLVKYEHEVTVPGPWQRISDVRDANAAVGHYWFSKDTMRFFDSRVESALYGGRFFITSEKRGFDDDARRTYAVRVAMDDGKIEQIGTAMNFIEDARDYARELVKQGSTTNIWNNEAVDRDHLDRSN